MTNLPYKKIEELSMHRNKQKYSLGQHFLSPMAQVSSISIMCPFCSIWLRLCVRIVLPPHQCKHRCGFGSGTLLKPGEKIEMKTDWTAGVDP